MDEHSITINNKEVFDFYKKHNLNFETTNLLFINIMNNLITNMDTSINSTLADKLLSTISGLSCKFSTLETNISQYQSNIADIISLKFNDYRRDYLEEIKLILTSNNVDHIAPLIKETNENMLAKTSVILTELIPKNQQVMTTDINNNFKLLQASLSSETNKLLSNTIDRHVIDEFKQNINQTIMQTHSTLTGIITASESRIEGKLKHSDDKLNNISKLFAETNHSTSTLQNSVTEMLKKFEKGVGKGNVSEHVTYNILLALYPCAQIDHVGNDVKESGDIVLIRNNKPKILIENKDHDTTNVPRNEVTKFIRDCEIQNCCGIMLAQNKGIANKENFEIQIHNGNVLLYVHETKFDVEKIKTAIEIVENFKMKLDEVIVKDNDCVIEKDMLDDINKEFSSYINQKYTLIKLVKDFNDKINTSITELKMPTLEKYLSSRFASSNVQTDNTCKYCERYVPKSMLQHYRYCISKHEYDAKHGIITEQTPIITVELQDPKPPSPTVVKPKTRRTKT